MKRDNELIQVAQELVKEVTNDYFSSDCQFEEWTSMSRNRVSCRVLTQNINGNYVCPNFISVERNKLNGIECWVDYCFVDPKRVQLSNEVIIKLRKVLY